MTHPAYRLLPVGLDLGLVLGLVLGFAGAAAAEPTHGAFGHPSSPHRGRIGVQVQPMTPELREHFEAPSDRGVLVNRVEADRPAARAGVRVGDVLITGDGEPIREPFDLVKVVGRVPEGGTLELGVIRRGKERTLSVEPEGGPSPWVDSEPWSQWLERGLHRGGERLRRHLHEIERRLEELEQRFDKIPGAQKTSL